MTYTPTPGQQVRVVKCHMRRAAHVGSIGVVREVGQQAGQPYVDLTLPHGQECSALEVAPVWQPGEVITPEMGEPPVGSVVEDESGVEWVREDDLNWVHSTSVVPWAWASSLEKRNCVLVSLPDAQPEEPKPLDMPEPEGVGTVVEVQYPTHRHLVTRIAASNDRYGECRWASPTFPSPRTWEVLRSPAVSIRIASQAETPTPQPQTREVPLNEVRAGDRVTLVVTVDRVDGDGRIFVPVESGYSRPLPRDVLGMVATVTRPQNPLPTTPGAVGTATVRGVPGVRVHYINSGCAGATAHWWSPGKVIEGFEWHEPKHLADYEPLLEGEES